MSTHNQDYRANIRGKLLATASALALSAYVSLAGAAKAGDADRPPIWIELGGQLNRIVSNQEDVAPPFFSTISAAGLPSPLDTEKAPKYSIDENGKFSFQPDGSDWVFSASVQYGKSSNKHRINQQTAPAPVMAGSFTFIPSIEKFVETEWASSEKHTILDFEVGKDVGLGMFGHEGMSEIGLGVRVAQFSSVSQAFVNADPTIHFPTQHLANIFQFVLYDIDRELYTENDYTERGFKGVGPTVSWQGSSPFAGNADNTELSIDWSARASVLFGRQKARGHHQSTRDACPNYVYCAYPSYHTVTVGPDMPHNRSRRVTVPNIGGSIGLSFKSGDAKVSFGYRADLFVNAMDTGIDARKSSNMLFHGPYASISVGLGD